MGKLILTFAFLAVFAFPHSSVTAQEPSLPQNIQDFLEEFEDEEGAGAEYILERLAYYLEYPLNLNFANYNQLIELGLLNELQVHSLLSYRRNFGLFITLYELQAVPLFDHRTISRILPFVMVSPEEFDYSGSFRRMITYGRSQYFTRYQQLLEQQRGYTPAPSTGGSRYAGSPYRLYKRYRYTFHNHLSIGFTAEKDPGEEFFQGSQPYGFDYYSAHFFLREYGRIQGLAIGDYEVNIGQGLVIWSGFGTGKSSFVHNVRKSAYPIKQYTSVNENQFLRGIATTIDLDRFNLTTFLSHKPVDANIGETDDEGNVMFVTSLQTSGLHRTPSEIANKHSIHQSVGGIHLQFDHEILRIGATALHTRLSAPLLPQQHPYNQFYFRGQNLSNFGMDYNLLYRNFLLFGETAFSDNGGMATLNGATYQLDSRTGISIVQRHYQKNYQTLWGNAFGENSNTSNESGIYLGMNTSFAPFISFQGYIDFFHFPWLRFGIDGPARGYDMLSQLNYRHSARSEFYVRFRQKSRDQNFTAENKIRELRPATRTSMRFHLSHEISSQVILRSRLELSEFHRQIPGDYSRGYMLYQDINWRPDRIPVRFAFRYALFDTDWDTRIYAYENDVLYAFSIPAYFDRGSRFYILTSYSIGRTTDIWLRFAQSWFANRNTIGSGLDSIDGNTRSEVKAQVRLRW